jgi:hypothetical protein
MLDPTLAAAIYTVLTVIVVCFQLALARGAPWGERAMGGKYPGAFPPALRIAAAVQALLLTFVALVVLTRAGVTLPTPFNGPGFATFSNGAIWFVVVLSVVAAVLNTITPSKKERALWAPVTIVQLYCAVVVAWS